MKRGNLKSEASLQPVCFDYGVPDLSNRYPSRRVRKKGQKTFGVVMSDDDLKSLRVMVACAGLSLRDFMRMVVMDAQRKLARALGIRHHYKACTLTASEQDELSIRYNLVCQALRNKYQREEHN